MKPTSGLLIAIAAFVVNPCPGSLAVAQAPVERPAQSQPQDQAQDNVLAYHGGAGRSGNFTVPGLTWQRARSLHLDQAFQARISGNVYAQPLFWRTPGSNTGRLLVATEDNNVYALDATTGHLIWARSLGKPVPRSARRHRHSRNRRSHPISLSRRRRRRCVRSTSSHFCIIAQ